MFSVYSCFFWPTLGAQIEAKMILELLVMQALADLLIRERMSGAGSGWFRGFLTPASHASTAIQVLPQKARFGVSDCVDMAAANLVWAGHSR